MIHDSSRKEGQVARRIGLKVSIGAFGCKGCPIVVVQIERDIFGQRKLLADLHLHLIGGDVHGIVIDLQQELVAVNAVQIQDIFVCFAGFGILFRAAVGINLGAGIVVQRRSRHILVILGRHGHGVVRQADGEIQQLRRGVIHHHGDCQRRALAQGVPVHIAFRVHIVLGRQSQPELQLIAFRSLSGFELRVQGVAGVAPVAAVCIVVSAVDSTGEGFGHDLAGGQVQRLIMGGRGVPDGYKADLADLVAIFTVDGVALGHVGIIRHQGVAAKVVIGAVAAVVDRGGVDIIAAHIGFPDLIARDILLVGADVKHGSIGPVAIEAQNGDRVSCSRFAFICGSALYINKALHICAAGIIFVQCVRIGQFNCDLDACRSIGRDRHRITGAECYCCVQRRGPGVHIAANIIVVADIVVEHVLGEQVGSQVVGLLHIGQVVDREGEGIYAGLRRIVAQLGLDLAVGSGSGGVFAHKDVAVSGDSRAHVGQAGALLQDGIVVAAAFFLIQRNSGGHQEALGQLTGRQAGLLRQIVLTDVLRHQGHHTGNLRRGHGSAGHGLIGRAARYRAVDGIDVSAGGGDFRLQLQRAGNAPGGEVAHGVILAVVNGGADAFADGQGSLIIEDVALLVGHRRGGCLQHRAVSLGDRDAGCGLGVVRQVHIDGAARVVVDHGGNRAGRYRRFSLLIEGGGTAGADRNGALQRVAHGSPVSLRADAVDKDILLVARDGGNGLVAIAGGLDVEHHGLVHLQVAAGKAVVYHGGHRHGVGEGGGRTDGVKAHVVGIEIAGQIVGVLCPAVGVAGGHGNHHAAVCQIVQNCLVGLGAVSGRAGVAGAQGQVDGVGAQDDGVLDGDHIVGIVRAATAAEHLHGDDLRVRRNALHIDRVQRAGEAAVRVRDVGVGRRDALNMGAVFTLAIIVMGDIRILIHIVEAKGNLAADISVLCGIAADGGNVQLIPHVGNFCLVQQIQPFLVLRNRQTGKTGLVGQGILKPGGTEGLMVGVNAGVDDRYAAARAGIAGRIGHAGTDLGRGCGHIGIGRLGGLHHIRLIAGFDQDLLNARDLFDGLNLTVFHIGGNDIGRQGQVPDHVQFLAVKSLGGNGLRHGFLILFHFVAIGHRSIAGNNFVHCDALLRSERHCGLTA